MLLSIYLVPANQRETNQLGIFNGTLYFLGGFIPNAIASLSYQMHVLRLIYAVFPRSLETFQG